MHLMKQSLLMRYSSRRRLGPVYFFRHSHMALNGVRLRIIIVFGCLRQMKAELDAEFKKRTSEVSFYL